MNELDEFIEACQIFKSYADHFQGFHAEHDIIYSGIETDVISEDSEDGERLTELGWHISSDAGMWAHFT